MEKIVIEAKTENLDRVLAFIDEQLEKIDCPPKVNIQLDVAVEELFVNIASYAYTPDTGMAEIEIKTEDNAEKVFITFIDSGIEYDPLKKPDPDVTLSVQERQIGGLGIFMVKKSMDDMYYERKDGKNILTIVKDLK